MFPGNDDKKNKDKQTSFNHTIIKKPHPISNKTDSGFTGPLLIYENEKPKNINETSDLQNLHMDHENILPTPDGMPNVEEHPEGPPYQHIGTYSGPWSPPKQKPKDEVLVKPLDDKTSFIGPFNPDFKMPVAPPKTKKGNKTTSNNTVNKKRPPIPQQPVFQQPQFTTAHRPEEILQIINQHPELANYPPGSVFEIHNYDPNQNFQRPYGQNQDPNRPFLPNQVEPAVPNYPNIPIDQIIKHVQNGQIPPGLSRLPFGQPQFAQNPNLFAPPGLQYPQTQLNSNQTGGKNIKQT